MSWNWGHDPVARLSPMSLDQTELLGRTYCKNHNCHLSVFTIFHTPKRVSSHECAKRVSSHECTKTVVMSVQDMMFLKTPHTVA